MSRIRLVVVALATVAASLLLAGGASARTHDRNHDRIPDRWEKRHHLSLHVNQARRDQDRDGLRNRGEFRAHLNPRDADSDDDGIEDGDENAGTVASFADGVLTISLAGGGTLEGTVTHATEVECDDASSASMSREPESGDDRGGDDQGDDPGGQGDEGDEGDDDQDEDDDAQCGPGALQRGVTVKEAELRTSGGTAVFEEVELRR